MLAIAVDDGTRCRRSFVQRNMLPAMLTTIHPRRLLMFFA